MNYAGTFDAKLLSNGPGTTAHAYRLDAPHAHAPADAIIVPDAHFLFNADFKRAGVDLVLSADGRELVLHDYFKGQIRAPLASPDGAHLTGDLVKALTGEVQVSQADGAAASTGQVIGHVTKLQGTATAIRNGVAIILHQGDNVEKGDVVQSGSDSTLGVTFIDGTVFGLSSNARMVLNEMVYDPNGSNNSTLISLVAGTISFVAGETAKHGDMKIDTPVATMGIRGTAVLVEIDFDVPGQNGTPNAKFQVLVEPDGHTGSYVLFDKTTLQPIAVVNQAGQQINISNGVVSQTNSPLPPDIQKLITDVFSLKFTDNTNPKSTTHFTDIGVYDTLAPIKVAGGATATPIVQFTVTNAAASSASTAPQPHMPGAPKAAVLDASGNVSQAFKLTEQVGKTGVSDLDATSGKVSFLDVNISDQPSVSVKFASFAYQNAQHLDVTGALSALQFKDILATEVNIGVVQDATHINFGTATWTYNIADHAFDFLAAGESLTLTYIVRVDNNFAQSNEYTEIPITITVTGTNDAPVITTSAQKIAFSGGTSVAGGPLTSQDPTSGTLAFGDVDLTDTHTVSSVLSSAVLQGGGTVPPGPLALFEKALTASLATDSAGTGNGTINWSLANLPVYVADFIPAGQTLTLTYTVTVTDEHGATSSQTVTVTITGTDTPAVVWIATTTNEGSTGALWSHAANWETGTVPTANDDVIVITDQLHGLTPSFPVTIDQAAFAKTISMNDFGGGTAPEIDNHSSLTVSGAFSVNADAKVYNFSDGTLSIGGKAEFLDQSTLSNSGMLKLLGGGDFGSHANITNAGTLELVGGTLNISGELQNSDGETSGLIQVDVGADLALTGGGINGGHITIEAIPVVQQDPPGALQLKGSATISNGTLDNAGTITVSGTGNAFDGETVTTNGSLEILTSGALTLDQGTTVDNSGGTVSVDNGATLSLSSASMTGGLLTNAVGGSVALIGNAALMSGTLGNHGLIAVSGSGNTLDGETVTNDTDAVITIALAGVLMLTGTSIAAGAIHNSGAIDITGDSAIDGSAIDGGSIVIGSQNGDTGEHLRTTHVGDTEESPYQEFSPVTLTLDGGASVANAGVTVGQYDTLDVTGTDSVTLSNVTVDSSGTIHVDKNALLVLEHSTISGGDLVNAGTVHIETDASTTFDGVNVDNSNGVILIDDDGARPVPSTFALDGATTITGGTLTVGLAGTLEIAGAGATLSGVALDNSGIVEIDLKAILDLAGTTISGGQLSISGSIETTGSSLLGGTITNNGLIEIKSGILDIIGVVTGTGSIEIDAGATLQLDGSSSQSVVFNGDGGDLLLNGSLSGSISGLAATDKLDLTGIIYGDNPTGTYDAETGVLTISDNAGHQVSLTLTGADYTNAHFAGSDDGHGGTLITLNANDDVPVIAATDKQQSGSVAELANTTGSSTMDPAPVASGVVHFHDVDLTDRPTATISAQSVSWTAANQTDLSASLTPDQISALEHALALTQSGNTNNGAVDWSYAITDGALDFLAAGETVTVTSTITLDDHQGGTDTAQVTVTITGSNDTPVITSAAQSGGVTELAATTGSTAQDTVSGAITFADVDFTDTHSVAITGVSTSGDVTGLPDGKAVLSWLSLGELADSTGGAAGSDNWSFSAQDKAFDYLAVGESVTLVYNVEINDQHGGVVDTSVTITVTGTNDTPAITSAAQSGIVTELAHSTGATTSDMASGTITFTDVDLTDTHGVTVTSVSASGEVAGLPDNKAILSWLSLGELTDSTNGTTGSDNWTFLAQDKAFDYLATGESVTLTYTVEVDDHHGGVVDTPVTISITGSNDSPVITSAAQSGAITELAETTGSTTSDMANGTVTFVDADLTDTHGMTVTGVNPSGDVAGLPDSKAILSWLSLGDLTDSTGRTIGSENWTFSAHDKAFDYLAAGESVTLTYTVEVDDHHGGVVDTPVTITIIGANDTPVITSAAQSGAITELTETTGSTTSDTANGTVTFVDADLSDTHGVTVSGVSASGQTDGLSDIKTLMSLLSLGELTDSSDGATGSQDWTFSAQDKTFDYLAAGESVTLTYNVEVNDHHGGVIDTPVTITVTGANDTPVITSAAQSGAITELADGAGATTPDTANGTITFVDADLSDTHGVTVTDVSASGDVSGLPDSKAILSWLSLGELTDSAGGATGSDNWTFSAQDKAFDYLAAGESVTLTYNVAVDDHHGGVVGVPVTVTITGSNDTPVITSAAQSGAITELADTTGSTTHDTANGTITFTDADLTDSHGVTVTGVSASGEVAGLPDTNAMMNWLSLGELTDATGGATGSDGWTFSAKDKAFDYLAAGQSVTLTYNVEVDDHHGGVVDTPVTITITGSNDAPVIESEANPAKQIFVLGETTDENNTAHAPVTFTSPIAGTLTVSDKDAGDTLSASVLGDAVVKYNGSTELPSGLDLSALTDQHAVTFDSATSDGRKDVLNWTYDPSGADLDFLKPGDTLTITYQAQVNDGHGAVGTQPLTVTIAGGGGALLLGSNESETFNNVGGGVTIFSSGGHDSFVFNPNFGSATIGDFDVHKDTIEIDHSLFASVSAILAGAQSANSGHDTVITDAAHDAITLKGVTLAQLQAHQNDFHII